MESYVSFWGLALDVARGVPTAVAYEAKEAFDGQLFFGGVCCLYIAFASAPWPVLLTILAGGILGMFWRDGHTRPAKGTLDEAALDGFATALIVLLSQLVMSYIAPSLRLPNHVLAMGVVVSMLMLSSWRLIFRMKMPENGPEITPEQLDRAFLGLNLLWVAGAIAFIGINKDLFPVFPNRDFVLGAVPLVLLKMEYRVSKNRLAILSGTALPSRRNQLLKIRDGFWTADTSLHSKGPEIRLQVAFFLILALPSLSVLVHMFLGSFPQDNVEWMQFSANIGAFVTLLALWIQIKMLNQNAANIVQKAIDNLDAGEGGAA